MTFYILENKKPKKCDVSDANIFLGGDEKIIKQNILKELYISTVFLCVDYSHGYNTKPILFETMIFDNKTKNDLYQKRYSDYDVALKTHNKIIDIIGNYKENKKKLLKLIENKLDSILEKND